jgi:murein DD-endopeptidase MepM/ murein hydrolase activator NlpD
VSLDIEHLLARARPTSSPDAPSPTGPSEAAAERLKLQRLASEFEAMLLTQMLREMREAGRWEEDGEHDTFGAMPLFEMIDAELASHLAKAQGLGVSREMLEAFDRSAGNTGATGVTEIVNSTYPSPEKRTPEVTSPFGWRPDPFTGEARFHRGVDLKAAYGEDVAARAPGRAISAGSEGSYGTTVVLEHADGSRTRFAHLSVALVRPGDWVESGQSIGRAGSSGRATGPHLHLEHLDRNGRPVDPLVLADPLHEKRR